MSWLNLICQVCGKPKVGPGSSSLCNCMNTDILDIKVKETVDHPDHYKSNKFEVIDIIEDYNLGFNLGNLLKYVLRAGKKDPTKELEDLEKAKWYLERHINNLRNNK